MNDIRVVFVTLFEACPPTSGVAAVAFGCASHLPCETTLVQTGTVRSGDRTIGAVTVVTVPHRSGTRITKLIGFPMLVGKIVSELRRLNPEYVILGGTWVGYLALLKVAIQVACPATRIIYHAHNVEYILRRYRERRFIAELTRLAEKHLLAHCELSFAVSEVDQNLFEQLYGRRPGLLPNGVDCSAWEDLGPSEAAAARRRYELGPQAVLFMGAYEYPPNREAIEFLVHCVMPELLKVVGTTQLVITGGSVPYTRPWLVNPGVVTRRELMCIIRASRLGVAPIFNGSGTRLKILDYMAGGLPVVSTAKGAEGIGAKDVVHLLYAESKAEFCKAILRLFKDRGLSDRLSAQAFALVHERFDWHVGLREFCERLQLG